MRTNKKIKPILKDELYFGVAYKDSLDGNAVDTPPHFATVPRKVAIFLIRKTVLFESSLAKEQKIKSILKDELYFGALKRIRTHDLLVRSQTLYPTELPAQNILKCCGLFKPP